MAGSNDDNTFGDYLNSEEDDSISTKSGSYEIGRGYGLANGVWDIGARVVSAITDRDPRYVDDEGNATTFPQDDNFSRRAFLGTTRDIGGLALLGGVASVVTSTGKDSDENQGRPVSNQDYYANLPMQGERIPWGDARRYLSEDSQSKVKDAAGELDLAPEDGEFSFEYRGVRNGSVYGTTTWTLPDDAFGQDNDSEPEIVEFDNMKYREGE